MRYSVRIVLWIWFGLITGLFLVSSVVTVRSVNRVLEIENYVTLLDHAKHHGHLALVDAQEQYIHQAHTIILGNKSDSGRYNKAQQATEARLSQLKASCQSVDATNGISNIETTLMLTDQYFRGTVLKNIEASDSDVKFSYHNQLEVFANLTRTQILDLNEVLDQKSFTARQNQTAFLARMKNVTVGTLAAGFLVALIVTMIITMMIGGPISRLHEAFNLFGAGNMQARVSPTGPKELNELGKGFNIMAADLVKAHGQMADKERMAAMGEIAAGVAHELNNPLGVITGYLKLVQKDITGVQREQDLSIIRDEVANCRDIVRGLLELARPSKLKRTSLNVVTLLNDVRERFENSEPEFNPEFNVKSANSEILVRVDEAAIRQVLNNLIRNAAEAAGSDGKVAIMIKEDEVAVAIAISDSGKGIEQGFRADIFKPFKTTKEKGLGLGLAISLAIVKNHNGDIKVDQGSLGGARFTVSLPFTSPEDSELKT